MKIPLVLFKTMISGTKIRAKSWCKVSWYQLSKKQYFISLHKFEESISSEFLPKTSLLCANVVYLFVRRYIFTKKTKRIRHVVWSWFSIDLKKNLENPENPENPWKSGTFLQIFKIQTRFSSTLLSSTLISDVYSIIIHHPW